MAQVKTITTRFKDVDQKKEYSVTVTDDGYFRLLNGKPEDENPNPIADIHDDGSVKFYGPVSFNGAEGSPIYACGENYIAFSDGTQIVYGYAKHDDGDNKTTTITFAQPFRDAYSMVPYDIGIGGTATYGGISWNTTEMEFRFGNDKDTNSLVYLVVGRWK